MKKWFSLLLAAMMLTLAACAATAPGSTAPSETTAPVTTLPTTPAEPSLRLTVAFSQGGRIPPRPGCRRLLGETGGALR